VLLLCCLWRAEEQERECDAYPGQRDEGEEGGVSG
jgi:hypothetical protein